MYVRGRGKSVQLQVTRAGQPRKNRHRIVAGAWKKSTQENRKPSRHDSLLYDETYGAKRFRNHHPTGAAAAAHESNNAGRPNSGNCRVTTGQKKPCSSRTNSNAKRSRSAAANEHGLRRGCRPAHGLSVYREKCSVRSGDDRGPVYGFTRCCCQRRSRDAM